MSDTLSLPRPDDWHLHLRDGAMLSGVAACSAEHFARALVMPNLDPPVTTAAMAAAYRARIRDALPPAAMFEPLMTLYLTEETDIHDLRAAHRAGILTAVKLYPAGATTNSAAGVREIDRVMPVLEAMAEEGVPLCVHGEVTDPATDIFDREAVFIERVLDPLRRRLPGLKVVFEHVTTAEAVAYVRDAPEGLAATITAHHLAIDRTHMLAGGLRPHYYCLPVAKRARHRAALIAAATSGDPRFFFGSDSAPHARPAKEAMVGCAGCFTAPLALPLLATLFGAAGRLNALEGFVARHGAAFYGLAPNGGTITLRRAPPDMPAEIETGAGAVALFTPPEGLGWHVGTVTPEAS